MDGSTMPRTKDDGDRITPSGTPAPLRYCQECGHPFYPSRQDQVFHKPACRHAHHRRREQRGSQLYDDAMDWRRTRRKGGFTDLTRQLDDWIREDREREARNKEIREAHQRQLKAEGN